jgi:predicted enzyme related to lactoylglutathione lyase
VQVAAVDEVTDRARDLGATVLLEPRDGPAGRRSVIRTASGGDIAFWQRRR